MENRDADQLRICKKHVSSRRGSIIMSLRRCCSVGKVRSKWHDHAHMSLVEMLLYVHCKQLVSCRDGQLISLLNLSYNVCATPIIVHRSNRVTYLFGLTSHSTIYSHVGTEPSLPGYYQYFLRPE